MLKSSDKVELRRNRIVEAASRSLSIIVLLVCAGGGYSTQVYGSQQSKAGRAPRKNTGRRVLTNMETFPNFMSHHKSPQDVGVGVHLVIDRVGSRFILRVAYILTAAVLNTLPDPTEPLASCVVNVRSLRQKRGVELPVMDGHNLSPRPSQKFTDESVRKGGFFNMDITDAVRKLGGLVEVEVIIGSIKAGPVSIVAENKSP